MLRICIKKSRWSLQRSYAVLNILISCEYRASDEVYRTCSRLELIHILYQKLYHNCTQCFGTAGIKDTRTKSLHLSQLKNMFVVEQNTGIQYHIHYLFYFSTSWFVTFPLLYFDSRCVSIFLKPCKSVVWFSFFSTSITNYCFYSHLFND